MRVSERLAPAKEAVDMAPEGGNGVGADHAGDEERSAWGEGSVGGAEEGQDHLSVVEAFGGHN